MHIHNYSKKNLYYSHPAYQRLSKLIAEQLFVMSYRRLINPHCCMPEEPYNNFIKLYPELKELIP